MLIYDPITLSQKLIAYQSITPDHVGTIDFLIDILKNLGFTCQKFTFYDELYQAKVDNLYARLGTNGKNFCFAGHTDVVPIGDLTKWSVDPFAGKIIGGKLYGRGSTDMKCAIACFISACADLCNQYNQANFNNSISLLLTGDEEGHATNGTPKVLTELAKQQEQIDLCLLGEPSNPYEFGEMIKIGRRGSLNGTLKIYGKQGHVAYPEYAHNPIEDFMQAYKILKNIPLDHGDQFFQPSNLEFTSIDIDNPTCNIIPNMITSNFNVRFNKNYTATTLLATLEKRLATLGIKYNLTILPASEPFINQPTVFCEQLTTAITSTIGKIPKLGTTGGTSDARFMQALCPVIEFGLVANTAHQIDEYVNLQDLHDLKMIYKKFLDQHIFN